MREKGGARVRESGKSTLSPPAQQAGEVSELRPRFRDESGHRLDLVRRHRARVAHLAAKVEATDRTSRRGSRSARPERPSHLDSEYLLGRTRSSPRGMHRATG